MICSQACTCEDPVGKEDKEDRYDSIVHIITSMIECMVPMEIYAQLFSHHRVVWIIHLKQFWVHIAIVNIQMSLQNRFGHNFV